MTARFPRSSVLRLLMILLLARAAHSYAKDKQKLDKGLQSIVNTLANWGEKISTPGAHAVLRPLKQSQANGKLMILYELYATGGPKDQSFALLQWQITQSEPQVLSPEVFIGDDGKVCLTDKKPCSAPVQFAFLPAKGEPFRLLLISKDGKSKIAFLTVPDPIAGADQSCGVEVLRVTPKFEAAMLRGSGFKPHAEIKYTSNSAGELLENKLKADGDGRFTLVLEPFVKGTDTGVDTVSFESESCAPRVSYKWGSTED
jgi:hypothetical protein